MAQLAADHWPHAFDRVEVRFLWRPRAFVEHLDALLVTVPQYAAARLQRLAQGAHESLRPRSNRNFNPLKEATRTTRTITMEKGSGGGNNETGQKIADVRRE